MNILIPHKWLLEHLDTKADPNTIRENLSLCGPSVETIDTIKGDQVYDIEVTTNRVDSMSVRGIAREAASILPEFDIKATLKDQSLPKINSNLLELDFQVTNDDSVCHRILAIKLENVNIEASPQWLKDRLEQVGQRPLNNAIDITNYVMWEIGHPIHAFDYDRLTEKKIIVREAKKGETVTTLDDKTHTMKGGEVVFDDGTGAIVDLPGIMGTKNTVVTEKTKNVLLWIESIDSVKIRYASMTHAIRSQAAILNEKNVDPNLGVDAILRGVQLFEEICSAKIASQLLDINPNPSSPKEIILTQEKLDTYMGLHIPSKRVERILTNLGFKVEINKEENKASSALNTKYSILNTYFVTPPTFREKDITIYQDIIEEIARIHGYHNLPSTIMDTPIPDNPPNEDFHFEHKIKSLLVGWGAQEIYTYSMVSKDIAQASQYALKEHLMLKNPLVDDMTYMRRSLIPSLLQVIGDNQTENITIFEMQNVYHPAQDPSQLPHEELQLAILTTKKYPHLKGLLDALMGKLFIAAEIKPKSVHYDSFSPTSSGKILVDGQEIGKIGKIDSQNAYALIISMESLQAVSSSHPRYIPIIKTPPIIEDLTFSVPKNTYIQPIIDAIQNSNDLVENVILKDTYAPKGKSHTNYTFTITYRDPKTPLSAEEVSPLRKKIVDMLDKKHQSNLVGTLQ